MFHIDIEVQLQVRRPIDNSEFRSYSWPPKEEYYFTGRLGAFLICYVGFSKYSKPVDKRCEWAVLHDYILDPNDVLPWIEYGHRFCDRMNIEKPPRCDHTQMPIPQWNAPCST